MREDFRVRSLSTMGFAQHGENMADWSTHLEPVTNIPPNAGTWLFNQTGIPLPQDHVYIRSNFSVPTQTGDPWVVDVVMTEKHQFSLNSLRMFPKAELTMVLECAGNGRALMTPTPDGTPWTLGGSSATTFEGVWLRDVLHSWAIPDGTTDLVFTGADWGAVPDGGEVPYQFALRVNDAREGDAMLATAIAGEPLSREHGAPLRLVVPGQYAMKSVKWIRRIEASPTPFVGHFVQKYRYIGDDQEPDDTPVGPIRVRSLIANPTEGARVPVGPLRVVGSAWSAGSPIARVDISQDGGDTWSQADLKPQPSVYAACPWSATVHPPGGVATIVARATDAEGNVQPLDPRWNANGYGNNVAHRITIVAG